MMEDSRRGMKRVKVKVSSKCPNPLFEQWLEEWRQEAASKGSDLQYCFGKALKSLRKYPLPLKSGKECAVLECFGDRLCLLLDRKLTEYRVSHPEVDFEQQSGTMTFATTVGREDIVLPKKKKRPCKESTGGLKDTLTKVISPHRGREYVPAWRSGPFAILITLLNHEKTPGNPDFMTKINLQHEAQTLCDASFTRPDPGSHYTAWSSMSQLIKKGLVHKYSNPAKFSLTDNGRQLAEQLLENGEPQENQVNTAMVPIEHTKSSSELCIPSMSVSYDSESSGLKKLSPATNGDVVFDPRTFDIILLVDTAETAGASKKRHDQTLAELSDMKVRFEVRRLAVGDFIWIARSKSSDVELVLPYVVERKRMDDFGASIKDQRFREQKFRLKQSGIQNLIYLVESHGSDQHVGLPLSTLQQAAVNTQVIDGFTLKHSTDHRHSMVYLASLTTILERTYLGKTLLACSKEDLISSSVHDDFIMLMNFKDFNKASGKIRNFLVKEMFIRHLLQLKGLSVEKALAIVLHYPTPASLVSAFSAQRDENLLSTIVYGSKKKNIGPVISKALSVIYGQEKLK